ncbi:MAG: hypothetical protein IPK59_16315 [Rhodospirillaceae bacterium]|nr:hypothetical protein [Rhodospirillaceae bacterium]
MLHSPPRALCPVYLLISPVDEKIDFRPVLGLTATPVLAESGIATFSKLKGSRVGAARDAGDAYRRVVQGRVAQGRVAQGRVAQGRVELGRVELGRVALGRLALGHNA